MKDCKWITSTLAQGSDNQLYYFKKEFELEKIERARVDISAQARYKLYINDALVGVGPCKGTREKTFCPPYLWRQAVKPQHVSDFYPF